MAKDDDALATRKDLREASETTKKDIREASEATKRDIREASAATKRDLREVSEATKKNLREAFERTNGDIQLLRKDMTQGFNDVNDQLNSFIQMSGDRFLATDKRLDNLEAGQERLELINRNNIE